MCKNLMYFIRRIYQINCNITDPDKIVDNVELSGGYYPDNLVVSIHGDMENCYV
jgi:hypothetical protein